MAVDPIDDLVRRLEDWTPPKGETLRDFELQLRAAYGGRRCYFRRPFDPTRYIVRADRDSTKGKRNGHPSGK